jgi:hypothetical protein
MSLTERTPINDILTTPLFPLPTHIGDSLTPLTTTFCYFAARRLNIPTPETDSRHLEHSPATSVRYFAL